ncbi:Virulence-associated protein [endosymbiont DhMRE of Dentiscutata heterogama]|uniref:HigA family addiction module antitoxin n=1 Tax=endosymbiont DhMRE of Dentiscutata heterogama TaxID=1609546 RepID=UPI000629D9B6|nr:HigA family addiction module antitoxin [endosymbiont DhMRE of Dentiscutata heterogama]CFW92998.1 Virulence-associated protein [endosymbiont DhMRE of Dentiscutata heterogama]
MEVKQKLIPIHPGEILKDELDYLDISQAELARAINVSTRRINEICQAKRGISTDTALRLGFYFKMGEKGAEFWLNLQQKYERECLKGIVTRKGKEMRQQIRPLSKERLSI